MKYCFSIQRYTLYSIFIEGKRCSDEGGLLNKYDDVFGSVPHNVFFTPGYLGIEKGDFNFFIKAKPLALE